jgi:hypothetical protein
MLLAALSWPPAPPPSARTPLPSAPTLPPAVEAVWRSSSSSSNDCMSRLQLKPRCVRMPPRSCTHTAARGQAGARLCRGHAQQTQVQHGGGRWRTKACNTLDECLLAGSKTFIMICVYHAVVHSTCSASVTLSVAQAVICLYPIPHCTEAIPGACTSHTYPCRCGLCVRL